jgi:hypothetical protein
MAQAGSADMSMGMRAGAVPVKLTVPVMEPAVAGSTAGAGWAVMGWAASPDVGAVVCLHPARVRAVRRRMVVERRVTIFLG